MSLISFSPLQDGVTGVNAAATNTPLSTIYNDYNGNITNANISASAAIDQTKVSLLSVGAKTAYVSTTESTASGAYTDLATTTDTVTVTIGTSGLALCLIQASMTNTTTGVANGTSVAVSGANTIAAGATTVPIVLYNPASTVNPNGGTFSGHALLTGLTAGSTTFKMKYISGGGTTTFFSNRRITVIPL